MKVYGTVDQASTAAAAKYWNAHGGILGHPIKVVVLNDNGDPSTAVSQLIQYLDSHPKPNMIEGGTSGIDSGGMPPLAKRDNLLDINVDDGGNQCSADAQSTCPTTFDPGPTAAYQQAPVAAWFIKHHYKKVGILQEEDAFSESETPLLQAALTKAGVKTYVASFAPTAVDVRPQISELKSDGVQAVYAEALAAAAGYEGVGRSQLGLNSLPFVYDYGAGSLDLTTIIPKGDLANSYEGISDSTDPYFNMPGRRLLTHDCTATCWSQPYIVASFQWQDLVTLHDAAEQAGSIKQTALINALQHLDKKYQDDKLNMTSQGIEFTPSDHFDISPLADKAYEVVPVGPVKDGLLYYK